MRLFRDFLEEQLKDPEFAKEYYALEPEMNEIRAEIEAALDEADDQAESTDVRLSREDVFSSARKIIKDYNHEE